MMKVSGFCTECHKIKMVRVSRISRDPRGICSDCELSEREARAKDKKPGG